LCRDRNGSKRKSEVGVGEIATSENEENEGKRAKQSKEGKGRETEVEAKKGEKRQL